MNRHLLLARGAFALALVTLAACQDPAKPDVAAHPPDPIEPPSVEDCAASQEWLPITPALGVPTYVRPAAHPETECPFYRGAWQTFLLATQPDTRSDFAGEPTLKSYAVLDDVFRRYAPVDDLLAPSGTPRGTSNRAWLGDIKQAGGREVLFDRNGHTLYYGIHVNQAFVDFVHENQLDTAKAIQNADPNLFLPAGLAELKSAWQEVEGVTDPSDPELANYIWTKAWVPTLTQASDGTIGEDRDHPIQITVRLLAIHAVFTIPGHPEFVWGSMEHTDVDPSTGETDTKAADAHRNVAPVVAPDSMGNLKNPTIADPNNLDNGSVVAAAGNFLIYKPGVAANQGDQSIGEKDVVLDPSTQTFRLKATGALAETPIYRMFPASKSNTVDPDDAITSLNHNVEQLFLQAQRAGHLDPNDKRMHYRLVGAQWMDKPGFFTLDSTLQNDQVNPLLLDPAKYTSVNQSQERADVLSNKGTGMANSDAVLADLREHGSDSAFSILAGEDRMSSTAMESFTQRPDSFFNCFSCHNTQAVTAKGVPLSKGDIAQVQLLKPKLLNVSHVFSQLVLEECGEDPANLVDNEDSPGAKRVQCP
jgi:hypothetical protein